MPRAAPASTLPLTQNGKVVDTQGYSFDPEDVI
jgi:hypothetical protein